MIGKSKRDNYLGDIISVETLYMSHINIYGGSNVWKWELFFCDLVENEGRKAAGAKMK
jgi:hypothetical protein